MRAIKSSMKNKTPKHIAAISPPDKSAKTVACPVPGPVIK